MKVLDLHSKLQIGKYADENNLEIKGYLASGRNGHVYQTVCGKALKLTTDLAEVHNSLRLSSLSLDNVVNFYNFTEVGVREFIIEMELLDTNGVEATFDELECALDEADGDLLDCELDGFNVSLEAEKMLVDLKAAVADAGSYKVALTDIHEGNIGRTASGDYKVFDQRTLNMSDVKLMNQLSSMHDDFKLCKKEAVPAVELSSSLPAKNAL